MAGKQKIAAFHKTGWDYGTTSTKTESDKLRQENKTEFHSFTCGVDRRKEVK